MGAFGLHADGVGKRPVGGWRVRALLAFMALLLLTACAGPGTQPTPTLGLDLSATETPPAPEPAPSAEPAPTTGPVPTNTRTPMLTATPRPLLTATPRPTAPATATRRPTTVPTGPTAPPAVLSNPTKLTRVEVGEEDEVYPLVAAGGATGNTLFLAGKGVLRSDDKGATWDEIFDGADAPNVTALVVAPSDPKVIYIGISQDCAQTAKRHGYATYDGGATWAAIGNNLRAITVDPKNPQLVYAVDCSGLVRSSNGGRTWSAMADSPVAAGAKALIAVAPTSPQALYLAIEAEGGKMKIVRSTDRGKTWEGVTPKVEQTTKPDQELPGAEANVAATSPLALVVDASNAEIVLVSTSSGIFQTGDGGATWAMLDQGLDETVPPQSAKVRGRITTALVGDPNKAGAFWVGTGASNVEGVGVYRTRDRGETWRKPTTGLEGKRVLSLALGGVADDRLLYIATDDGLWVMTAP
jgi:photosystem II stability/assembly factor-like uncharacterized protein